MLYTVGAMDICNGSLMCVIGLYNISLSLYGIYVLYEYLKLADVYNDAVAIVAAMLAVCPIIIYTPMLIRLVRTNNSDPKVIDMLSVLVQRQQAVHSEPESDDDDDDDMLLPPTTLTGWRN